MLSKNEVILEDIECADMIGVSLKEYQDSLNTIKVSTDGCKYNKDIDSDSKFFNYLGISEEDLKKRR